MERALKIRFKLKKISKRNRLTVFKSNNHLYAQLDIAEQIGKDIAKKIMSQGIKDVAFDRGKYKYHGLIKILADAARSEGLNF